VTIDSSVAGATGATEMRFRNAGGSWSSWQTYSATKAWTLPAGDGDKSVFAEYSTLSGNPLELSTSIVLDTTAPVTTDNSDGLTHSAFTLVLTPTDATSGVVLTEYRIDGHAWKEGTTALLRLAVHRKPGSLSRGTHTIQYRSTDAAGNVESIKSCTVKLG